MKLLIRHACRKDGTLHGASRPGYRQIRPIALPVEIGGRDATNKIGQGIFTLGLAGQAKFFAAFSQEKRLAELAAQR